MPTTRRALAVLLPAALAVGALSSCSLANPDRSSAGRALVGSVRALPGVASVRATYNKPITLQSGNLEISVRMADDATPAQVVAVGRTAYAGFRSSLDDHETDLHLTAGDDRVHVRGFEPRASVADVTDELEVAASVFSRGAVSAELTTQDVSNGRRLQDTIDLRLPAGTTADDLQPALTGIRAAHPDDPQRGWGVTAADGSGLHRDLGFPSADLDTKRAELTVLVGLLARRASVGVDLSERRGHGFEGITTTTLTGRSGALDLTDPRVRRTVVAAAERQMHALPAGNGGFYYRLVVDGHDVADVDANICAVDGPAISRVLNRYQFGLGATQPCPNA